MYLKTFVIFLCFFVYFQIANADHPKLSEEQLKSTYSLVQWTYIFSGQEGDVTKSRVQSYLKTKLKIYNLTEEEVDVMASVLTDVHILEGTFLTLMGYNGYDKNIVDTSLPIQVDQAV